MSAPELFSIGDVAKLFAEGKVGYFDPENACRH